MIMGLFLSDDFITPFSPFSTSKLARLPHLTEKTQVNLLFGPFLSLVFWRVVFASSSKNHLHKAQAREKKSITRVRLLSCLSLHYVEVISGFAFRSSGFISRFKIPFRFHFDIRPTS